MKRNKPNSGPGRGVPRSRATARSTPSLRRAPAPSPTEEKPTRIARGFDFTRRLIVLGVVVAVLIITYASTLSVYFSQQRQIGETRQLIAEKEASIEKLTDEIKRWEDPEYVKAQARTRLGWVVPGEVGFRVIGPDGKPIGGGAEIIREGDTPESLQTWWQRLWGSIGAADAPATAGKPTPTPKR